MTSDIDMETPKGLEYEFCAVIRDAALLYFRTARTNEGYADRILAISEEGMRKLGEELLVSSKE